jgi:hypothetical protein
VAALACATVHRCILSHHYEFCDRLEDDLSDVAVRSLAGRMNVNVEMHIQTAFHHA